MKTKRNKLKSFSMIWDSLEWFENGLRSSGSKHTWHNLEPFEIIRNDLASLEHIWSHLRSNGFKWLHMISNDSKSSQMASDDFKSFQCCPCVRIISHDFKWCQRVPNNFKCCPMILIDSEGAQVIILIDSLEWFQWIPNESIQFQFNSMCLKCFQMISSDVNWFQMILADCE